MESVSIKPTFICVTNNRDQKEYVNANNINRIFPNGSNQTEVEYTTKDSFGNDTYSYGKICDGFESKLNIIT